MSKYPFRDISAELGFDFNFWEFKGRGHITKTEWDCIQKHTRDKKYLEIGCYHGYSTTAAEYAFWIACIDKSIRPLVRKLANDVYEGDSTDPLIYNQIQDGRFDFLLIDGNHTYEYCSQDLKNYVPKVKVGGIVAIHDYGINGTYLGPWGVTKAVEEFFNESQYIETVDSLILFRKE